MWITAEQVFLKKLVSNGYLRLIAYRHIVIGPYLSQCFLDSKIILAYKALFGNRIPAPAFVSFSYNNFVINHLGELSLDSLLAYLGKRVIYVFYT